MIRLIGTVTLALLAPAALAQTADQPAPWANKFFLPDIAQNPRQDAPPVIVKDFGTVPHGTLCVHRFTVTNIYDVPVQVIAVRRSCGCLQAYPPEKVLQPTESADFIVSMDTGQFKGENARIIYVTFRGVLDQTEFQDTAVLRVQANSRTDVQLNPGRIDFGTVAQGGRVEPQTVTVEYSGRRRDWRVVGVVPPAGPIDVDVKNLGGGFLGTKYQVSVALKPDAPAGPVAEVVSLRTNDPSAPVVQVNVTGTVQAPVTLSTDVARFGKVKVGQTATLRVLVRGTGGTPFVVQKVEEDADGVSVETFPGANPVQVVTVKFRPTRPGAVRKDVRLQASLGGGISATIRVEGEGEGEPQMP
ncbi:MAG TPA: DUF1573 domain-containing protein [Fimbriiglobus sp.]|nr:DUF1573 domain-containing protein [Fimbriiglobus sp.]